MLKEKRVRELLEQTIRGRRATTNVLKETSTKQKKTDSGKLEEIEDRGMKKMIFRKAIPNSAAWKEDYEIIWIII